MFGIGCLGNRSGQDLLDVAHFRGFAMTDIHIHGKRQLTGLGQPAADIADATANPEDLVDHQHRRQLLPAGGHRPIAGQLTVGGEH